MFSLFFAYLFFFPDAKLRVGQMTGKRKRNEEEKEMRKAKKPAVASWLQA